MRHFIFSYGTLAHKNVAEITAETLDYLPAYLAGYKRNFKALIESRKFAAAGVHEDENETLLGMLVEVPEKSLEAFDKRESHYYRIQLHPSRIKLHSKDELPEGTYHLYVPEKPERPNDNIPMVQSYMDVIVEAFLTYEGNLAQKIVESFLEHANDPLFNDRNNPRYSRALKNASVDLIDNLMQAHAQDLIIKRAEPKKEVSLNPKLERSIFQTLKFYSLFKYPLTSKEVNENLYKYSDSVHIKETEGTLNLMCQNGELGKIKDYYFISGNESDVETRKTRKFIAEKFWNRTKLYGQYMKMIPFIKMVSICNNLAYDNPSEQSDIDLFIIIKEGRMWTSRFLLTIVLHFFGVRRHGNKVAGRFCLSFFVTEKAMDLEKIELKPEDPYLAYWARNLKPIYGLETYQNFTGKNKDWLSSYGLKFSEERLKHLYAEEKESLIKRFGEFLLGRCLGDFVEKIMKKTLKKKTLSSMSKLGEDASVVVTDHMLKFHNHDKRKSIYEKWSN